MSKNDDSLTFERAKELLEYEPEAGELRWLKGKHAGVIAGCPNDRGYLRVMIDQRSHKAHRLAWLLANGEWPQAHIDHINRNRSDNRLGNLRVATTSENRQNEHGPHANNKVGVRGVRASGAKYTATITAQGRVRHLGTFASIDEAQRAYEQARHRLHPFSPEAVQNFGVSTQTS